MTHVNRIRGRKGIWSVATGGALALACVFGVSEASAQVNFQGSAQPPPPQPAPAQADGGADHDLWVGRLGIGWYGVSDIPVGSSGATLSAPAIGVRYWLDRSLGFDVGLGFAMQSGSVTDASGTSTDKPSTTAFLIHGGLPLALHTEKHYTLLITPEVNLGIASGSTKSGGNDVDHSGFRFDIGARAGAEIHFGFMGIPALALEGSVGLFLTTQNGKTSSGGTSTKDSNTFVGTSSFNNPWDFFRSSVAARYYF